MNAPADFQRYSELCIALIRQLARDPGGFNAEGVRAVADFGRHRGAIYSCFAEAGREIAHRECRSADIADYAPYKEHGWSSSPDDPDDGEPAMYQEYVTAGSAHGAAFQVLSQVLPAEIEPGESASDELRRALLTFEFDRRELERMISRMRREQAVLSPTPSVAVAENAESPAAEPEVIGSGEPLVTLKELAEITEVVLKTIHQRPVTSRPPSVPGSDPPLYRLSAIERWWKESKFRDVPELTGDHIAAILRLRRNRRFRL